MKVHLFALLLATSAFAQRPATIVNAACGPKDVHFDVVLNKSQHAVEHPQPGKALVYFVQDIGSENPFGAGSAQVTKVGIDGAWVGANQNDSWFSISVDPGVHHVCVNAQARIFERVTEFDHFTAEAGQTYYFRVRDFMWQTRRLEFGQVNSDQAMYMIASYPLSVSHASK